MSQYPSRRHLRVLDVMTTDVFTADPLDGFKAVAQRLYETGVSALPVIDSDRRVVGLISEGDLLVKEGGKPRGSLLHPAEARTLAGKASAVVAAEAMTSPAVTITADATVAEAARLMHGRGLKRLPVVDADGRLLGIVSRHDVIKVFVRTDASIRKEVLEGVIGRDLMIDTFGIAVEVEAGIVDISGQVERRTEIPVITLLIAGMDGVVAVENSLTYRWDDRHIEYAGTVPRGGIAGLS